MAVRQRRPARHVIKREPAPQMAQHAGKGDGLSTRQAKRRPHSGQEVRDGVRWDPSNYADPRQEYPWSWCPRYSESGTWPGLHLSPALTLVLSEGQHAAGGRRP